MKILPYGTAAVLKVGPLLTTAGAAATGLTLAQADILLGKEGTHTYAQKTESTSATDRSNGMYSIPLDGTTDTTTLGVLCVVINKTGAMPYSEKWTVVPVNIYQAFVLDTDKLLVDAVELNSVAASMAKLERSASSLTTGTSDNTGFTATTTAFDSTIVEATADHYKGCVVSFTSGALQGQRTACTAYALTGGRGRFTVDALTEIVPNGTTFVVS